MIPLLATSNAPRKSTHRAGVHPGARHLPVGWLAQAVRSVLGAPSPSHYAELDCLLCPYTAPAFHMPAGLCSAPMRDAWELGWQVAAGL